MACAWTPVPIVLVWVLDSNLHCVHSWCLFTVPSLTPLERFEASINILRIPLRGSTQRTASKSVNLVPKLALISLR